MSNPIQYEGIRPCKSKEISDFLVKQFFPNEPISRAFGLPTSQVTRWFPAQVQECLKQEASISAVDPSTGELIGVAINILVEKKLYSNVEGEGRGLLEVLDPKTEPIMVNIAKFLGILNQVSDDVYLTGSNSSKTLTTFNCIYLAVLPSHGGLGIGKQLIEESEKIARKLHVGFCQVDTTSEFSYRIFHKHCGYQVVREIDLAQYIPGMEKVDNGAHMKGRILLKEIV